MFQFNHKKNIILLIAYLLIAYLLIIYLLIVTAEEKNSKQFYIECKGDETFWLQADGTMTIDNFKAKIETDQGIPAHEQRLVFAGKQLEGSHTISKVVTDAGEVETCRLHFILESTGGGTFRTRYGAISIYNVLVNMFDEKRCLFVN